MIYFNRKFSEPSSGDFIVSKDHLEISWTLPSNVGSLFNEVIDQGEVLLFLETVQHKNGNRLFRALSKGKVIDIPYSLKNNFYFVSQNKSLKDKIVCITGPTVVRREVYEKLIPICGGTYKSSFTKNINVLICNKSKQTIKLQKAKERDIQILTEIDFWGLVKTQ